MAAEKQISKNPQKGQIKTRGQTFVGKVVSAKMQNTVVVEWDYLRFSPKYERYERRKTRVSVHNPDEIHARIGDTVKICECRPISKTKHFVVVEKIAEAH